MFINLAARWWNFDYLQVGRFIKIKSEALVNTVNCEEYMGKGIAYQFKTRYPLNYNDYVKACKEGNLNIKDTWKAKTLLYNKIISEKVEKVLSELRGPIKKQALI